MKHGADLYGDDMKSFSTTESQIRSNFVEGHLVGIKPFSFVDRERGGYYERLDWDGQALDPGFKRLRVMARQCYVFCHIAIGETLDAYAAAESGANYIIDRGLTTEGQFASRLTSEGMILDPTADLYDIAFGLFAMAWWFRLSGDSRAVDVATASVLHLRQAMRSPSGLGYVARVGDAGPHQQNPHMHLFEAALFLFVFTQRPLFKELADELFALAANTLICSNTGTLSEMFDDNWRPLGILGAVRIEPGHHYEWAWLLHRYGLVSGDQTAFTLADQLFTFARKYGHDPATGLIVDAVQPDGTPLDRSFRIWPNLEYMKAMIAMRERCGDLPSWSMVELDATCTRIAGSFFSPRKSGPAARLAQGLWIDYLEADAATPKSDHVPVSTLYHIVFAFTELMRHRAGHEPFSGLPW